MVNSEIKNVILVGATGNLGPTILSTLLKSPFKISVLTRSSSTNTFPQSVNVIRADYDSLPSLTSALKGQDAVISLLAATTLQTAQITLIDAAVAAGVKRFIPSDFGSNTKDERLRKIVPVFEGKKGAVDYLRTKEGEGLSWSSVVTGAFFDWGLKVGFLGFDAATKTATLIDEGKGAFSATNLRTIGRALIKILQNPELTKNQYIYISSFDVSQAELLPIVEKVTGEKFTIKNVSTEELIKSGNEKLAKGDFSGIMELIRSVAFGKDGLGDSRPEGLWNEKLGLEKEDLEESVRLGLSGKLVGEE